jgi:prepilin-type N-terminal cleavage/methylation domain-containing protein
MKHSCRGASLIESLVALSVFAIGSAATSVWFASSMETNADTSRVMATVAAIADLRERMHANPLGVAAGDYNATSIGSSGCAAGCAASDLAADDLQRFTNTLREHVGYPVSHTLRCGVGSLCHVRVVAHGHTIMATSFQP